MSEIKELIGKTMREVVQDSPDRLKFVTTAGDAYLFHHAQGCCESVNIDDICGDLADLVGSPLIQAEENSSNENPPGIAKDGQESFTWTFYRFATAKGQVVVRWYGESNGYYSESVDFDKL